MADHWSAYVGLAWRDRGRGPEGYDCWGVFRLAFQGRTGINLPSYADDYRSAADATDTERLVAHGRDDWIEVPRMSMRECDAALMVITRRFHVGIVVRRGLVLHMPLGGTSEISPMSRFPTPTIFRHRRLI